MAINPSGRIIQGHVLDVLPELARESVHMCVTSPPYWGLRDYATDPQVWGGSDDCRHVWAPESKSCQRGKVGTESTLGGGLQSGGDGRVEDVSQGTFCSLCGAWRGSLGNEPSPDLYVQHLVGIFREVRRVLRSDGTLWLNLGASYASQGGNRHYGSYDGGTGRGYNSGMRPAGNGFKPKDLIPIPWMVAMALQADGWYLRSSIIWAKGLSFASHEVKCPACGHKHRAQYSGSCMPESCRDRPTQSYEYMFLLAKSKRYYYDQEAVREPPASYERKGGSAPYTAGGSATHGIGSESLHQMATGGRNLRSVWTINPHPFAGAHFATFPPKLIEPCILAGTSAKGVCPECGGPWERVVEKTDHGFADRTFRSEHKMGTDWNTDAMGGTTLAKVIESRTVGWRPSCDCSRDDVMPATVLDPFAGAGTTPMVAVEHGREFLGIELQPDYVRMANERLRNVQLALL